MVSITPPPPHEHLHSEGRWVRTACYRGPTIAQKTNYWVFRISNFGDFDYMLCTADTRYSWDRFCHEWKVEHYGGSGPFPDFVIQNLHCTWENHAACLRTTVATSEDFYAQLARYRPLLALPPATLQTLAGPLDELRVQTNLATQCASELAAEIDAHAFSKTASEEQHDTQQLLIQQKDATIARLATRCL
jgi:hypothetical protein